MEWKWVSTRVLKFLKFKMQPVNVFVSTEVDQKIFAVKILSLVTCTFLTQKKATRKFPDLQHIYSYMYKDDWNVAVAHSFTLFSLGY